MRNTTITSIVALALLAGSALAQPAPFPTNVPLEITYPHFPAASGEYVFTFDGDDEWRHLGQDTSGWIEWAGPFVPQTTQGHFLHELEGTTLLFNAIWLENGDLRVNLVHHPTITVTGPGNIPEPAALALTGAAGRLVLQRRRPRPSIR
jgi:hypothetical protein